MAFSSSSDTDGDLLLTQSKFQSLEGDGAEDDIFHHEATLTLNEEKICVASCDGYTVI